MGDIDSTSPVIFVESTFERQQQQKQRQNEQNNDSLKQDGAAVDDEQQQQHQQQQQENQQENEIILDDPLNAQKRINIERNQRSSDLENSDEEATNDDSKHASNVKEKEAKTFCSMCENYEADIEKLQMSERYLKEQVAAAQHLAERYQKELSGERLYRREMEAKTSTLCADTEREVKQALKVRQECEALIQEGDLRCRKMIEDQEENVNRLKEHIETMNDDLIQINTRYLNLLGANRKCATEMQAQTIELPQDVDQLQFLCLQLREEIIETRAAKEHIETLLKDEVTMLQVQRREDQLERRRVEKEYTDQLNGVSEELGLARSQLTTMQDTYAKIGEMDKRMTDYQEVIEDLEKQVKSMQKERADLEMTIATYKQKCAALQQELDTSEAVQKDFVKLSQNLQIELEKIRQAEQEVRWQFDDDVHACNQCQLHFTKNRTRLHCYHCGKIFCPTCLNATVPSGPHQRPAQVCQVCHTLLSRDTAPFFSHNASGPS